MMKNSVLLFINQIKRRKRKMKAEGSDLALKMSCRMIMTWLGYLIKKKYKGASFCKLAEQT